MRAKSLKIDPKKMYISPSGSYGTYIKLSPTVGVKILINHAYRTIKACKRSHSYRKALAEARLIKQAYDSGIVPKVYGVKVISLHGRYYAGIAMRHLGKVTLSKATAIDVDYTPKENIIDDVRERLLEYGIDHGDLHYGNVMVFKGSYYAIDFSPDWISTFKVAA